ncbi:unnamed protein product [Sordaria macrospora k-hell]|uniref:WGS project CABT00000000 data, contig 2.47 n=1 Tax=Sordaria macrospora (strain ATCC MYA-333 / DSM 997 / K(L3346) / K-hell) TaxID=771870 RepID=F7W8V8_SORMK|nr:uncharacterized protein SMAC_07737 [Sordaria macrospora k-hell]CCC05081.1 unnamed protein product [Sordaria macrospora k-hell]
MWPFGSSYPTVAAADVDNQTFDYIVAHSRLRPSLRLSESPNVSVLLLERGQIRDNFLSRIPLLSQNYNFPLLQSVVRHSEPIPSANNRRAAVWTAETLGGASRINAMLWTRGVAGGYNAWSEEYGLDGWSWEKVEPAFRSIEGIVDIRKPGLELECIPFVEEAAKRVGLPVGDGVNAAEAKAQGIMPLEQTLDGRGQRLSAYKAWLPREVARERRKRLIICPGVVASRLLFNKDGTRAIGVRIQSGDHEHTVHARREVILCAGTIGTPQLLMLSGIGPPEQLESIGVPVIRNHPAVGQGLSDHVNLPIIMELPRKHTIHCLENALVFLWHLLLYLFLGKGLLASGSTPRSIFVRTSALDEDTLTVRTRDPSDQDTMDASLGRNIPDVEIIIIPISCLAVNVPGRAFFTWYTTLVQPHSKGHIELASADPLADVKIFYPMMTDERDRATMKKAVRFSMRLAEEFGKTGYPYEAPLAFAPGMDLGYLDSIYESKPGLWQRLWGKEKPADEEPVPVPGKDLLPGAGQPSPAFSTQITHQDSKKLDWRTVTDQEIDAYVSRVCVSSLHVSCTCRMSNNPREGVVDQKLKVHGVENLRIADASVFPKIPSAHTMAPVVMVAERCAEFVKAEWEERKDR